MGLQDIRNSSNGTVDGRCDLINFLPVAVDVGAFATNGTILIRRDYVVLGVDGRSFGLAKDWIYDCAIVQMCKCANEELGK